MTKFGRLEKKPSLHFAGESGFESGSEMFISVPDRIQIRPKVSDPYRSSFGSGSATLFLNQKTDLGCSSRFLDPGSGVFAIPDLETVSGSRKNTRSRIRICNTASKCTFTSIFKDKKSKRSQKLIKSRFFLPIFAC